MSRHPDEHAILGLARRIDSSEVRSEFLNQMCDQDADMLDRIRQRLGDDSQPRARRENETTEDVSSVHDGTVVDGRFRLLEVIGQGGMGTVWVAEQFRPVKRKVAVKLIKAGMDSRQVLARFDAERQALALMDHQNIAKVLEGGLTGQGRPFFVMEYVKGVPLTQYCDDARLSIKERLNLFIPICQAVQHAHQKGIIHRDLKPSNILVCLYDGKPVPKVIDFGLAKAMHQPLTEQTLYTAHGMMLGTPLYMSPEQAETNHLDIDTRSDIYSLGVILYELLTGSTPLEKQQLKEAAANEVLRLIKEVEPQKPSTRLSGSDSLPGIAAPRNIDPQLLRRSLTGDLDWVVMKALEKERTRRYGTANGLAADIQRHLDDEPVNAGPPSSKYRMGKFLKRNRAAVTAATLVAGTLVAGVIVSSAFLIWALTEKKHAETSLQKEQNTNAQLGVLANDLNNIAVLYGEETKSTKAIQAFEHVKVSFERLVAANPAVTDYRYLLAVAHNNTGRMYFRLDNLAEAMKSYRQALAQFKQLVEQEPEVEKYRLALATTYNNVARTHSRADNFTEACLSFQKANTEMQRLVNEHPTDPEHRIDLATTYRELALNYKKAGDPTNEISSLKECISIREQLVIEDPTDRGHQQRLVSGLSGLGAAYKQIGKLAEALATQKRELEILEPMQKVDPDNTSLLVVLGGGYVNSGNLALQLNELETVEKYLSKGIDVLTPLLTTSTEAARVRQYLCDAHLGRAILFEESNRFDDAVQEWDKAIEFDSGDRKSEFQKRRDAATSNAESADR